MKMSEIADSYRRAAEIFDALAGTLSDPEYIPNEFAVNEQLEIGAGLLLCFLRDTITDSPKESLSRGEILVLLETLSRDRDFFPRGLGVVMYDMEPENETEIERGEV